MALRLEALDAFHHRIARDPARHRPKVIVKGVTYHQLKIERRPEGCQVQVFLDI